MRKIRFLNGFFLFKHDFWDNPIFNGCHKNRNTAFWLNMQEAISRSSRPITCRWFSRRKPLPGTSFCGGTSETGYVRRFTGKKLFSSPAGFCRGLWKKSWNWWCTTPGITTARSRKRTAPCTIPDTACLKGARTKAGCERTTFISKWANILPPQPRSQSGPGRLCLLSPSGNNMVSGLAPFFCFSAYIIFTNPSSFLNKGQIK